MKQFNLVMILMGTLWLAFNAIITALKMINEKRDTIILGRWEGKDIDHEYRRKIFRSDWIPLFFILNLITGVFLILIWSLPELAAVTDKPTFKSIRNIIIILPLFGFLGFLGWGISDYIYIRRKLKKEEKMES